MKHTSATDPILLKLSRTCIKTLGQHGIVCIEQLIDRDLRDLQKLKGIGPQKVDEIVFLLQNLPFDYLSKALPPNPKNNPYLGLKRPLVHELNHLRFDLGDEYVKRGIAYYNSGAVTSVETADDEHTHYRARVRGSRPYDVSVYMNSGQKKSTCTCPYAKGWNYARFTCKHVVAALLQIAYQQRIEHFGIDSPESISLRKLSYLLKENKPQLKLIENYDLKYILTFTDNHWDLYPEAVYDQLGNRSSYQLFRMYGNSSPWQQLNPQSSKDKVIVSFLKSIYEEEMGPYRMSGSSNQRTEEFADIFAVLRGETLALLHETDAAQAVYISPQESRLGVQFSRASASPEQENSKDRLNLRFIITHDDKTFPISDCQLISASPCWVYHYGRVMEVNANSLTSKILMDIESDRIILQEKELPAFFQDLFPAMVKNNIHIDFEDGLCLEQNPQPVPRLYLYEIGSLLQLALKFAYQDTEVDNSHDNSLIYTIGTHQGPENGGIQILSCERDSEAEQTWLEKLQPAGLIREGTSWFFKPAYEALDWVIKQLPELAKSGFEIYGEDDLRKFARPKKMTSKSFKIKSGESWFELDGTLNFEGFDLALKDIQEVLVPGTSYVKLSDYRTGEIPEAWLKKLKKVLHLTDSSKEKARVPKIMANQLDELLQEADCVDVDEQFENYVARLQSFETIEETTPPKAFKGELRTYQKAGLSWLEFLRKYEFGGILADDMGLGKTIQVLAFIQKTAEESGKKPKCLIVAPRSVIQNWEAESTSFTPELGVYIHHGPDRLQDPDEWPDASLIITTYSTLRIDLETFKEIAFDMAVLDESHSMRNPASQTFKAIRLINARFRLCLSGTPVQNTVMDLWTQFHFLNPGLIGNQAHFLNKWVKPIEKYENKDAGETLQKMVDPFILRRTKKKVAKDLPSLTSSIVHCPMEHSQKTIYEKHRKVYYDIINKSIDEKGVRESRFAVLEGLTRLRQISCSPQLIKSKTTEASKVKRFLELAEELISEGHRALVFSQFVQFLKILEGEVQKRNWSYEYLDGSTKDRQERVDRFQKDSSAKLFLISLKAGGEGLNLTAADYVFIMDPWWNPAAERQAMDRTHRIGQTEKVFVYRMICPDTVEEKILKLQARKQMLSEQLITAEAGIFKELDREELLGLFE